uniref:Gustatory receptor n=1 Tax=Plectus sambesii TaxID=2011161 RepID=A0A914W8I0_9BILA
MAFATAALINRHRSPHLQSSNGCSSNVHNSQQSNDVFNRQTDYVVDYRFDGHRPSMSATETYPLTLVVNRSGMAGGGGGCKFVSVTRRLRFVLLLLRFLCFFPARVRGKGCTSSPVVTVILLISSLAMATVNLALFGYTARISWLYKTHFGMLHASTVSSIITGVKPLINCVSFFVFLVNLKAHKTLLKQLNSVDASFRSAFGQTPNITLMSAVMLTICALAFVIPASVRGVEFCLMGERLGDKKLADISLILVPMLSVWNIVPLVYYNLMNCIVRCWCRILTQALRSERRTKRYDLRFYYKHFLKISTVQDCISNVFNPFILFSLGWTLFCLCLTIYFITQATSSMDEPVGTLRNAAQQQMWRKIVRFNLVWSSLQIMVAVGYIVTICGTGTKTNEETRRILSTVLSLVPDVETEEDRFQVTCFVHKTNTQYMWGMTVWRTFPLERGGFFTLVSLIVTYSFLLLKLKSSAIPTSERADIIINATQS